MARTGQVSGHLLAWRRALVRGSRQETETRNWGRAAMALMTICKCAPLALLLLAQPALAAKPPNSRQPFAATAPERAYILEQMRLFVISLQQIADGLATGNKAEVAEAAAARGRSANANDPGFPEDARAEAATAMEADGRRDPRGIRRPRRQRQVRRANGKEPDHSGGDHAQLRRLPSKLPARILRTVSRFHADGRPPLAQRLHAKRLDPDQGERRVCNA